MPKKNRPLNVRLDNRHEEIIEKIIKKYADQGVEISRSEAIRVALRFWEKETKKKA
ncbi:MAG TPA: hypothetical protein VGR56_09060 [Nitrososphaerales archaeon]|nr:hypothetical protein [Nitrososphaerales archaeon]